LDHLYWDVYLNDPKGLADFVDSTVSFLHIYIGDVREAVVHSEEDDRVSKFGRVIYNKNAWDAEKFQDMKDDLCLPNHYEVLKEVLLRMEKYKCKRVDMGYLGRWKNPYQIAETHMPMGITITYETREGLCFFRCTFFNPDNWFSLQCKPIFKTDPIVQKEPQGSWNMNPVGLIAAKHEKCAANRRGVLNLIAAVTRDFDPDFTGLARSQFYYNQKTNTAYIEDPKAKTNKLLFPLAYYFREQGKVLFSDSAELPADRYKTTMVRDKKITHDIEHFDFL